jgi:hypothetical protein
MRYSKLLRIAVIAAIAFVVRPGQANFDLGIAAAWAAGDGGGRQCPGGR